MPIDFLDENEIFDLSKYNKEQPNEKPKKEKKKLTKKQKIMIVVVVLVVLLIIGLLTFVILKKDKSTGGVNNIEVVDSIKGYPYNLEDRDSEIYKENFMELKQNLESEEIDFDVYAESLAKLFAIDLYTLDNKISKYDVGSLDFIYESEKEKFANKLMDTMYKLIIDNSDKKRTQKLPKVKEVEITSQVPTIYKKNDISMAGYTIEANILYESNLGYDENVIITIIKEDNTLYVVSLESQEG